MNTRISKLKSHVITVLCLSVFSSIGYAKTKQASGESSVIVTEGQTAGGCQAPKYSSGEGLGLTLPFDYGVGHAYVHLNNKSAEVMFNHLNKATETVTKNEYYCVIEHQTLRQGAAISCTQQRLEAKSECIEKLGFSTQVEFWCEIRIDASGGTEPRARGF